ncbi:unnamed protein product [Paramecium sonneborni]|uniref:EGF-like domain-containing protein n=1 Tax=Paramecium sonneborni TaxID=65129 RepID=A0A8S1K1V1_9CILI|nr:unnamed protein product [Paramecium sonneborni]
MLQQSNYIFCDTCADVCKICTTSYSTSCSQCSTGAYLFGTTCYTDCPDVAPQKDSINNKCIATCTNYLEDGFCVNSCKPTSYIFTQEMKCYQMGCPEGTYQQLFSNFCQPCNIGCLTCSGGGITQCLSCKQNYFFNRDGSCSQSCSTHPDIIQNWVNYNCVQQCPFGTYLQSLSVGVLACKITCPQYYYSNICVSSCPSQTYIEGNFCISCAGPCQICFGITVNQCYQCDTGYYLIDTTCVETCPNTKPFGNLADQTCVSNCPQYLYSPQNICFYDCPAFLYYYELNGKKECVDQCYSKSYLSLGKCYECNSICKECFGPNNGNCLECELPYFLNQQTCGVTCPQFYDITDHQCKDACPVNLVIQGVNCQNKCDTGYLIYNQVCVNDCPSFAYQVDNYCYDCNLFCSTCFGSTANECFSCIDNYFLDGQSCKSVCPLFYNKETKECLKDCTDLYEITENKECVSSCPLNYITCKSKCVLVLEDGYYQDGNVCQKCDPKCSKCTSSTACQSCALNFYLEVQSCVNSCSNSYLYMDPLSRSCVTKCPYILYHLESYGKRFCVADCAYKLYDQCVLKCPKGMYSKDKVCTKCPQYCEECETATKCTKCLYGYYLENGSCLLSCINGKTDRKNVNCVDECDSSLFVYKNECLENCPTNPILYNNKKICSLSCPNNTYQNERECVDCDASCLTCIGPTDRNCITCQDGFYLDNQICTNLCSQQKMCSHLSYKSL